MNRRHRVGIYLAVAGLHVAAGVLARAEESPQVVVSEAVSGRLHTVDASADVNGTFVVAWSATDGGDGHQIVIRRFDRTGLALESEEVLYSVALGHGSKVAVSHGSGGEFIVAWDVGQDIYGQCPPSSTTLVQRFDGNGMPLLAEPVQVADACYPTVAATPDGGFVVLFEAEGVVWARSFAGDGNLLAEILLSDASRTYGSDMTVAPDGSGGFLGVWTEDGTVMAQRFRPDGELLGPAILVGTGEGIARHPVAALGPDHTHTVAWRDSQSGIFARLLDEEGEVLSDQLLVTIAPALAQTPSVARAADGATLVTWKVPRRWGPVNAIEGCWLSPWGSMAGAGVTLREGSNERTPPRVIVGPRDQSLVVFGEVEGDGWRILGHQVDVPPPGGLIQVRVPDPKILEAQTEAVFEVYRLGGYDGSASARFTTAHGSALPELDYAATDGTLNFGVGTEAHEVRIALVDDAEIEDVESFELLLFEPSTGAAVGGPARVRLYDNDGPGPAARGEPFELTGPDSIYPSWPQAAGDEDGFVVVWTEGEGGDWVRAMALDPSGETPGEVTTVQAGGGRKRLEDVVTDSAGEALVVWVESRGDQRSVMARRAHRTGEPIGAPIAVATGGCTVDPWGYENCTDFASASAASLGPGAYVVAYSGGSCCGAYSWAGTGGLKIPAGWDWWQADTDWAHVAAGSEENFVLSWQRWVDRGIEVELRDTVSGTAIGESLTVASVSSRPLYEHFADLATAPTGEVACLWSEWKAQGRGRELRTRVLGADLVTMGRSYLVDSIIEPVAPPPNIVFNDGDRLLAIWAGQNGTSRGLFGSQFDHRGCPVGSIFEIAHLGEPNSAFSAAVGPEGFLVVWENVHPEGNSQIMARAYEWADQPCQPRLRRPRGRRSLLLP